MTCSYGPIFVCFVRVTTFLVALEAPHLQSIVQQMFSKKLSAFPHSDRAVPAFISGLPTIQ